LVCVPSGFRNVLTVCVRSDRSSTLFPATNPPGSLAGTFIAVADPGGEAGTAGALAATEGRAIPLDWAASSDADGGTWGSDVSFDTEEAAFDGAADTGDARPGNPVIGTLTTRRPAVAITQRRNDRWGRSAAPKRTRARITSHPSGGAPKVQRPAGVDTGDPATAET